jgi:hypothetical protein
MDTPEVTDVVVPEAKPAKAKKPKYEGPACSVCGKPLTDPESVKAGIGPLCRAMGWTKEKVAERMAILKRDVVPEGWVKLADVHKECVLREIPVARLVRAIGGDRGMSDPIDSRFQVIYVGRARYMDPFVMTDAGMLILADRHLGQPAPEKKVRVVKPKVAKVITDSDGNTGTPKKAKKGQTAAADIDVNALWTEN